MAADRQSWREAVEMHTALTRWCESEFGKVMLGLRGEEIGREMTENPAMAVLAYNMYRSQGGALAGAVPFFISSEMSDLIEYAAETFQPEPIFPTDLLDLNGFMYFERPLYMPDRFNRPVRVAAVSWTVAMDGDESLDPTFPLARDDAFRELLEERHQQGVVDGLALTLWEPVDPAAWEKALTEFGPMPPLTPLHVTPWWWGMSFEGNEITPEGRPSGAEWWWKMVQTTWRLMAQTIATRTQARIPRPNRRERQRLGYPVDECVVVTLRRERHPGAEPTGEEAHYSHRFIRHGHWRNQWYASERVHRQIYIADMIVGPEDKPLIIKPRAYTWTR